MLLFNKNLLDEVVVIAEIGVNHGGSIDWIMNFLPQLKAARVDAVKFQLFTPKYHTTIQQESRFSFLQKLALKEKDFSEILDACKALNLNCFATPVTNDWVDYVATNCGVLKIASGDFTFSGITVPSLKSSAKVIASTGGSSMGEIIEFSNLARSIRGETDCKNSVALLHCISSYPPPLIESNLKSIPEITRETGFTVGFSSHFIEDAPLFVALALGARIFEIHVTDDKSRTDIRDHALSRTPKELGLLAEQLRTLNESLKVESKAVQPSEISLVNLMRKGLVYSRDIRRGTPLSIEDISFARPFNPKLPPVPELIGLKLNRDVNALYPIEPEDLGLQNS